MSSLRAVALVCERVITVRRAGIIGTLSGPSQGKLRASLVLSWLFACVACPERTAQAADAPSAAAAPSPAEAFPSASPAAVPSAPSQPQPATSPFTGGVDGATALPPAPPPTGAPRAASDALPPPPPPNGALAVAPRPGAVGSDLPALPAPRGVHLHDGFYLRMALGLGVSGVSVSTDAVSVPNYSFAGGGAAADLWIGGTPTPGLALGGALTGLGVSSTTRRVSGDSEAGDVMASMGLLGFFVDGFPDPARGFHFGGELGLASGVAEVKDSGKKFQGGGVGLGAWLGYDMWVSPQWSLGGLIRFTGSLTRENSDDVKYQTSVGGASLSFTALYH